MNYNIRTYRLFDKELKRLAKRYKSLKHGLEILIGELRKNPALGVDLGHGVHKVRMAISAKGKEKSAGARIITVILDLSDKEKEIGLHFIYDKSERENITDKELQDILKQNGLL